jgi:hypothetical protein
MRIENTLQALHTTNTELSKASSTIQSGFARMLDRGNPPLENESLQVTSAFVNQMYQEKVALAQIEVLRTHDNITGTLLQIKS